MGGFMPIKTSDVCEKLNVSPFWLHYLIRTRKIPKPLKDSSGDFVFDEGDLARLRLLLNNRNTGKEADHVLAQA